MDIFFAFLKAIPGAAASPLALIAYLATLLAWVFIAYRVNRFRELMKRIGSLPESDRIKAIKAELGFIDVPEGLTGEQYLRKRIHTFVFIGWLAACATVSTVGLKAVYDVYQQMIRADNLTAELLYPPSSEYMSAVNTLSNGEQMIAEAIAEIEPPMSKSELDEEVARLVRQRLSAEEITQRLAQSAGTARLSRANEVLVTAASRLDEAYGNLETCFREVRCRPGFDAKILCSALTGIRDVIAAVNSAAERIPGVHFNASGTMPILGGGSMDVNFASVDARNVIYLLSAAC